MNLSATRYVAAQNASAHEQHSVALDSGKLRASIGGMATGVVTRASPAVAGRTYTEAQVVQPVLMTEAHWNDFSFSGALNGEGYTLKRGELNAGIFGEGYVDRRHPHTLLHELMLSWQRELFSSPASRTRFHFSLAAGRGFVPFGSDDPMMRPLEKYPVNHHHSQIIEREQGIAAFQLARGQRSMALEVARFNGDEPTGPFTGPQWSRMGDSWAARLTLQPVSGLEIAGSRALVISPELRQGGAFNHAQHNVLARWDKPSVGGATRYLLAEWARTDEITKGRTAFQYSSLLAEGAVGWRWATIAARAEQTDRSEQMRLRDPFREPLGHVDFQILGVTQWKVATVGLEGPGLKNRSLHAAPFLEIARAVPTSRNTPSVFEPLVFYGKSTLWSFTAGFRVHAGTMRARMGRYGVMAQSSNGTMPGMPGMNAHGSE